jgi:hypothetical protein
MHFRMLFNLKVYKIDIWSVKIAFMLFGW